MKSRSIEWLLGKQENSNVDWLILSSNFPLTRQKAGNLFSFFVFYDKMMSLLLFKPNLFRISVYFLNKDISYEFYVQNLDVHNVMNIS